MRKIIIATLVCLSVASTAVAELMLVDATFITSKDSFRSEFRIPQISINGVSTTVVTFAYQFSGSAPEPYIMYCPINVSDQLDLAKIGEAAQTLIEEINETQPGMNFAPAFTIVKFFDNCTFDYPG